MRKKTIYFLTLLLVVILPRLSHAQYYWKFEEPRMYGADSASDFCRKLYSVLEASHEQFRDCSDSCAVLSDGSSQSLALDTLKFDAARDCYILRKANRAKYVAVFMRGSQEGPVYSSYSNLLQRIKECMPPDYEFKEKNGLWVRKKYCYLKQPVGKAEKIPVITVSVLYHRISGIYELQLEVEQPIF